MMKLHSVRQAAALSTLLVGTFLISSAMAEPTSQLATSGIRLSEVQITASKVDPHTIKHASMNFLALHTAVSPHIHQMGRWQVGPCPHVTGLEPAADAFVMRHMMEVAQSVGAPMPRGAPECAVNVEVVFTSQPQRLLDHIARAYPVLLGSSRSTGDATFKRAIQAWYLTETRVTPAFHPPAESDTNNANLYLALSDQPFKSGLAKIDPSYGVEAQPSGSTGSYFSKGLASDLVQVFVIVDTGRVAKHSLRSVADYLAMLALTRVRSLDACSALPSIIDLLSAGCDDREKPASLTDADSAYLKSLYASDLEANLNLEQADMRDRMVKTLAAK